MLKNLFKRFQRFFKAPKKINKDTIQNKETQISIQESTDEKFKISEPKPLSDARLEKKPDEKEGRIEFLVKPKEKRFINIGLDFGTSGTKVIYRDLIGKKAWLYNFHHKLDGYPNFVLPSSIRVAKGKLFFGEEAEQKTNIGNIFRSFKICMVCQNGLVDRGTCNVPHDRAIHPDSNQFLLSDGYNKIIQLAPHDLGTVFLAYVIGLVKDRIIHQYENKYDLNITINMCMPIDYLENLASREAFNRSLYYASLLSDKVGNGCDLVSMLHSLGEIKKECVQIPEEEARPTFVQPETIVAVFSYVMSPEADPGLYCIADVGAGTTDIAFFRLTRSVEEKLAIYYAKSHLIGANDIDAALLSWFESEGAFSNRRSTSFETEIIQKIRLLKETMGKTDAVKLKTSQGTFKITNAGYSNLCEPVSEKIFSNYKDTWSLAYKKEKTQSSWKKYTIFRIGGGSKIRDIGKILSRKPHDQLVREVTPKELLLPRDIESGLQIEDHFGLLAVAYGLSYHPAQYPEFLLPGEVLPYKPPPLPDKDIPPWYEYWEQM